MVKFDDVKTRLGQLGYTVSEADKPKIEFELQLILDYVVNYCNFHSVEAIPEILDKRIIDRVCSEYLLKQKNSGNLANFNYETAIKTLKEGDTQIQFDGEGMTAESRFDKLCDYMQRGFDKWISQHRRIKW